MDINFENSDYDVDMNEDMAVVEYGVPGEDVDEEKGKKKGKRKGNGKGKEKGNSKGRKKGKGKGSSIKEFMIMTMNYYGQIQGQLSK